MPKKLSAKCYQDNKERLQNKAQEKYQSFYKQQKEKNEIIWSPKI